MALFIEGSLEFFKPSEFIGVRVRNDSAKRSKENMAGRRAEVLRVEVGEFGLDGVVYSNVLSSGMAIGHLKWMRLLQAAHVAVSVSHSVVMRLACHCRAVLGVLRVE